MTSPAITIEATRPIAAAAALMMERKANRLPVTEDGRLMGIVTRADIVRTFARSDEEPGRGHSPGRPAARPVARSGRVHGDVENGIAGIEGRVERRSAAAIVERMVEMVPGVVGVNADIGWSMDDRDLRAPGPDYVSPKSPT